MIDPKITAHIARAAQAVQAHERARLQAAHAALASRNKTLAESLRTANAWAFADPGQPPPAPPPPPAARR